MRKTFTLILVGSTLLAACGLRDSRVNPLNWFGRSEPAPVTAQEPENTNPLIPRRAGLFARSRAERAIYLGTPIEQIADLTVERVPGGAIIRATGVAARQGYYEVQLTPSNEEEEAEDGVLIYRLEALRPTRNTAQGRQPTREVTAGRKVTDQQLRGVRAIRVEGELNARVARR
ncbi:MAG: hypothetical protein AAF744_14510 [Pseudomonadota bacterium]